MDLLMSQWNQFAQARKACICVGIMVCLGYLCSPLFSQNVSISSDGSDPNANAMLDIQNPSSGDGRGLLIPRVTEAQRTTGDSSLAGGLLDDGGDLRGGVAAQGLLVYQTDGTQGFYYNTSATTTPSWMYIGTGSGTVTSITASSPLTGGTISSSGSIGIDKANATTDGYLDNSDYTNFSSAYTDTSSATNANTASTIVKRDGSGNFSAGTITATLTGNADTATSATNVTGTVAVANGGTGATTAANARTNLGLGTIATQASDSVDIDGGAIDGTTIGGTTAAAGSFTSVTASSSNSYYLGTDKVLHRGNGALTGNLVVGDGGDSLSHSGSYEGYYNTFVGLSAGSSCTTGKSNTAVGYNALNTNASTDNNTAVGYTTLSSITTGKYNTAVGSTTLQSNTEGSYNVGVGCLALQANTTGLANTAVGNSALNANTEGTSNTGLGYAALHVNTTGDNNTAVGFDSLYVNTTGAKNVALGYGAGATNTTGLKNTFVGCNADASAADLTLAMAIGYKATVDASYKVVIGNASVTTIGGYAAWSNYSDRREKKEITDCNIGLEFIEKLRPVNYKYKEQDKLRNGFIAQEVEAVCKETGVEFGGLTKPANENGRYMLSYADFVVPLVNAVKELEARNKGLKQRLKQLEADHQALVQLQAQLKSIQQDLAEKK